MTIQKHPYGYWTNERIIEESKKYKTPIEFKINAPTAYKKANKKKLIKEMRWLKTDRHKKRGPRANYKYTKDVVVSFIQEHKCIIYADFRRINEYAYNQAKKNGWLPELGLIQDNSGKKFWTKKKVFEVARNYSNKTDFQKKITIKVNEYIEDSELMEEFEISVDAHFFCTRKANEHLSF